MKRLITSLFVLLVAAGAPCARAQDAEARYQALLSQAKAAAAPVDWQALRLAYADRPGFNVFDTSVDGARRQMRVAYGGKDYAGALAQAQMILDKDYVDGEAHLIASLAYRGLNQDAEADREQAIAVAIFKSVQTGDGLSAGQAFTVISVSEEYQLMQARGRQVTGQKLVNEGGHAYDVLDTVTRDGDRKSFYFLIDRVLLAEQKALNLGK